MSSSRVLIVDDQVEQLFALQALLERDGYEVFTASNGEEALRIASEVLPEIILLDVMMPGMQGPDVARKLKEDEELRYAPVVLLTSRDDVELLEECFEAGADDFLRKPFESRELLARVKAALRSRRVYEQLRAQRFENAELKATLVSRSGFAEMIGQSRSMKGLYRLIQKVSKSPVPILIHGESGTGKELVARAIHQESDRRDAPFVVQNCSAFSEQLIESELFGHVRGAFTGAQRDKPGLLTVADGGTFFLDEIGELPLSLQAKLLRVVQEGTFIPVGDTKPKKVNVRILAATHRDLPKMIAEGKFREDLFYRLNVITLVIPPLRDRKDDVPLLVKHFLARRGIPESKLPKETLQTILNYDWPGNIRQLENEIERLILLGSDEAVLAPQFLSPVLLNKQGDSSGIKAKYGSETASVSNEKNLKAATEALERVLIEQVLAETRRNKSEAARILGVSRSSLITKVQAYEISSDTDPRLDEEK